MFDNNSQSYGTHGVFPSEGNVDTTNQGNGWLASRLVQDLDKISLSKLYHIVSLVIYGVIAFSKSEKGVNTNDVSSFVIFCFISIVLYFLIEFVTKFGLGLNQSAKNIKAYLSSQKSLVIKILILIAVIMLFLSTTQAGDKFTNSFTHFFSAET